MECLGETWEQGIFIKIITLLASLPTLVSTVTSMRSSAIAFTGSTAVLTALCAAHKRKGERDITVRRL